VYETTETKKFICVACPVGCALTATVRETEVLQLEGNLCPRGVTYARDEMTNPLRTFTSTVRVKGGVLPVCPVRSRTPLPLAKVFEVTREVAKASLFAPITIGQVVIENVCGTGTDIVASRSLNVRSL
jgi:CxxC motif-containing protein